VKVFRILRAVLGTALLWGVLWLFPGVALGVYRILTLQIGMPIRVGLSVVGTWAVLWAIWGAASGAGFAVALAVAERHGSFAQLTFRRFASLGAIGALTPSAIFLTVAWFQSAFAALLVPFTFVLSLSGILGATSAVGTFALARRVPSGVPMSGGLTSA